MRTFKISKRAPGLSVAQFKLALSDTYNVCDEARKALRGKTLAEFWETSTVGPWMAYWLFQFCHSFQIHTIVDNVHFVRRGYAPDYRRAERKLAKDLRAAYHWDGTRKETK